MHTCTNIRFIFVFDESTNPQARNAHTQSQAFKTHSHTHRGGTRGRVGIINNIMGLGHLGYPCPLPPALNAHKDLYSPRANDVGRDNHSKIIRFKIYSNPQSSDKCREDGGARQSGPYSHPSIMSVFPHPTSFPLRNALKISNI